jgi:SAM-dependent methyltransferase
MKNADRWQPSKYVLRGGRLRASLDTAALGVGSRLIADLVAAHYADHLPRVARGRLADLGCGLAPLYGTYQPHVASVLCLDWPQSVHASPYVDVPTDLNAPIAWPDASLDTIILSDVLEHVVDARALWREMARLLAPGGHGVLNVPFLYGVHEAPHDYARYTQFALRRLAADVGLEVVSLQTLGGSLHVLADFLSKHVAAMPWVGHGLAVLMQATVTGLDATRWGQAIARRTGDRFPLGYFMVVRKAPA